MNYRLATILAREAVAADKTIVSDIKIADPISQIHIVYESTGVGASQATANASKCITKIEIVDGSDVLCSLSGDEAQAVDFYHRGIEPPNIPIYLDTMNAEMIFNINFGRYLYDPDLALDPKQFNNPQIKVTIDMGAGGLSSVAGFITILAHVFDQRIVSPSGFFMHKEIKDYALGSASHEYTDLPVDYPYRKLLIAAQTYGTGPEYLLNTIKLSEENDKKIPITATMFEILRAITGNTPPYRENIIVSGGASGLHFYCAPCYWPRVAISQWEGSNNAKTATVFGGDGGQGHYYLEGVGNNYNISVEGFAPHGAVQIPFGLQQDPDDWYDVSQLSSLKLDILSISGRTSSDKVQIFLQQHRRY